MITIHPQYIKDSAGQNLVVLHQQEFDSLMEQLTELESKLDSKSSQSDWADQLNEPQIALIEKGKKDIEENKVVSHEEAKERIESYIKKKSI